MKPAIVGFFIYNQSLRRYCIWLHAICMMAYLTRCCKNLAEEKEKDLSDFHTKNLPTSRKKIANLWAQCLRSLSNDRRPLTSTLNYLSPDFRGLRSSVDVQQKFNWLLNAKITIPSCWQNSLLEAATPRSGLIWSTHYTYVKILNEWFEKPKDAYRLSLSPYNSDLSLRQAVTVR